MEEGCHRALLNPAHPTWATLRTARALSISWSRQHEEESKPAITAPIRLCCGYAHVGGGVAAAAEAPPLPDWLEVVAAVIVTRAADG